MKQEQFLQVASPEEAKQRFQAHLCLEPLGEEPVPLAEALGRILSRDVTAPVDVPAFHRSNVDGFAVIAADTYGADEENPCTLRLSPERIPTGHVPQREIERGMAAAIATGAVIPRGANAVVMVEYTEIEGETLLVYRPVFPGENITFAGQDIMQGETVLRRGEYLSSRETGVLAALGLAEVWCYRKPRIAVLSTGDEIIAPGERMREGLIYDSNSRIVCDAIRENGGEPIFLGICKDDEAMLTTMLTQALAYDMVILSGGTSKGGGDFTYRVIDRLGKPGVVVHGVALKPGKPICLAVVQDKPVVVLPGFPTSAIFTFHEFVKPVIRALAGFPGASGLQQGGEREEQAVVRARAAVRFTSARGRLEYTLVNLVAGRQGYSAYPIGKGSGSVTTFSQADGFVKIGTQQEMILKDEEVTVYLLSKTLRLADLVSIGSHCVGLDYLISRLKAQGWQGKIVHVGSLAGLQAAKRGESDLSGIHLLDERSGTYNLPFVQGEDGLLLIRGYIRRQGILYRPDDPLFCSGTDFPTLLSRILHGEKRVLINRNKGSGTRILLDMLLQEVLSAQGLSLDEGRELLPGYDVEARSHNAVAASIALKKADWGIGIETVARDYGLGFSFLQNEHYDFLLPADRQDRPAVVAFFHLLQEEEVRTGLRKLGFEIPPDMGERLFP
ncbi:MAG: molybdopterin biosynthesis protein [Nitrospinota bacterium]|nr:MAG: molybdopterin biosynthesis protein [Nitrospinota bacterium]